ncbi:MAG: PAS domain S-box protein [Deltaproteobacteria bacterium]|nr:PAS domain S-box protein [Deltaproteobacteria bacterium]MBZ0218953.1 PAS domain S-box protein [Deltaproteobacteria bacterium]
MDQADRHGIMGELESLRKRIRELEKKEAERRRNLEENPATIEALMKYIPEGIIIVSAPDETVRMASREALRMSGNGPESIEGLKLKDLAGKCPVYHPDGRKLRDDENPLYIALREGRVISDREFTLRKPDGSETYVLANAGPVFDNAGKLLGAIVSWRDITERRRAEQAVLRERGLLSKVLALLPVGVWILDCSGNIVEGNDEGQRIWGGVRRVGIEEYGEYKAWWAETGKPIAPHEWAGARAIEKGETSLNEEVEIEGFNGVRRFIMNSAVPLTDERGRILGAVTVNQDITARKLGERMLDEAQRIARLGNWIWDPEKDQMCGSSEAYRIFGLREGQPMNMEEFMKMVHREDREALKNAIQDSLERGGGYEFDFRVEVKGALKYVQAIGRTEYRNGKPVAVRGTVQDITERKKTENELRDALSRIKTLSGLIPICANCKRIRDDRGYWMRIEKYIEDRSAAEFTHSLCPDCERKLYEEDKAA